MSYLMNDFKKTTPISHPLFCGADRWSAPRLFVACTNRDDVVSVYCQRTLRCGLEKPRLEPLTFQSVDGHHLLNLNPPQYGHRSWALSHGWGALPLFVWVNQDLIVVPFGKRSSTCEKEVLRFRCKAVQLPARCWFWTCWPKLRPVPCCSNTYWRWENAMS